MEKTFQLNSTISTMHDALPIRFAHHKTIDKPENHVLHINNYVEIYVYISGDHQYIVENSLYELRRGDIIVINPMEVHKALGAREVMYERFYFLVDQNALEQMYQNPLTRILSKTSSMGNLISFDENTRALVLEKLYAISNCFKDGKNDQLSAFADFLHILNFIDHQLHQDHTSCTNITHTPKLLKQTLSYIAANTASIQSITEVAAAMCVTPQYLSRYFSKHIGTPLKTYIQAKKVALAKDLLDQGGDVTQTCYDCGFNDCSYFIRIFKKYVGLTPMNYKRRTKQD